MAQLIGAAFAAQPPTDPPPSALRVTAQTIRNHFAAAGGALLAEEEARIAGAILWQPEGDDCWRLSRLSVLTGDGRRGLALGLLGAAGAEAARRRINELRLATRLSLPGNRALFGKAGFREVSLHCHPGFGYPTYVEMSRLLGGAVPADPPAYR